MLLEDRRDARRHVEVEREDDRQLGVVVEAVDHVVLRLELRVRSLAGGHPLTKDLLAVEPRRQRLRLLSEPLVGPLAPLPQVEDVLGRPVVMLRVRDLAEVDHLDQASVVDRAELGRALDVEPGVRAGEHLVDVLLEHAGLAVAELGDAAEVPVLALDPLRSVEPGHLDRHAVPERHDHVRLVARGALVASLESPRRDHLLERSP